MQSCVTLLESLETLKDNGINDKGIAALVDTLLEINELDDDDDVKALALLKHRAEWESDVDCNIEVCSYDDDQFEVGGATYLVLNESEREQRWDDALESYLDECVEGADQPYFDRDAWKRDAKFDGAGHTLASYDGAEHECDTGECGDGWYFIYRIN